MITRGVLVTLVLLASAVSSGAQVRQAVPPGASAVVNVKDYGARGDGATDDSDAIQSAVDALGTAKLGAARHPNVNGGATQIVGGTVVFPPGIYRTTRPIALRPWGRYVGQGRWASVIRLDSSVAGAAPVLRGNAAGWIHLADLAIETSGVARPGQNGLELHREGIPFGLRFTLERLNFYRTYNAIELDGDTTSSSVSDVYIRAPANYGFHQSGGGTSASRFETIYIANSGGAGFVMDDGVGNSLFSSIVTETTGGDGMRIRGAGRNTFDSLYLGDQVASTARGYGLSLISSSSNVFHSILVNGGRHLESAILFDGSFDNEIDGLYALSIINRYVIETRNSVGTPAHLMRMANVVRRVQMTSGGLLGMINDTLSPPNVMLDHIQDAQGDTRAPVQASDVLFRREILADHLSIRHGASPASTGAQGYGPPDPTERWSFYREFPGVPPYSFLSRGPASLIGVLPAPEALGPSIVTGGSSTFDGGVGAWKGTERLSIAAAPGGVSGSAGLVTVKANNVADSVVFAVSNLTPQALYKLTFSARNSEGVTSRFFVRVWSHSDRTLLATSNVILGTLYKAYTLYFTADGPTARLRISVARAVANDTALFDDFVLAPVMSAGSLRLSGGRVFGNTVGGGGGIELVGHDAASDPGTVRVAGGLKLDRVAFGALGNAADGVLFYCADCTPTPACAGGGRGAIAKRIAGAWVCS